jgi:hypothetical protein
MKDRRHTAAIERATEFYTHASGFCLRLISQPFRYAAVVIVSFIYL